MSTSIHPSAFVDEGAIIGDGTRIWHFCHISKAASIGKNCNLGQNVFVADNVKLGDNVKVQNNVSLYEGVILEDDVFCGPSVVFTNVINPRATVSRKDSYKPTKVKRGATLGANSTIICGATIGQYAFVGAGAVVVKDVADFSLVVGVPAIHIGWMSRHGERLDLPLTGHASAKCPATGEKYILNNDCVEVDQS